MPRKESKNQPDGRWARSLRSRVSSTTMRASLSASSRQFIVIRRTRHILTIINKYLSLAQAHYHVWFINGHEAKRCPPPCSMVVGLSSLRRQPVVVFCRYQIDILRPWPGKSPRYPREVARMLTPVTGCLLFIISIIRDASHSKRQGLGFGGDRKRNSQTARKEEVVVKDILRVQPTAWACTVLASGWCGGLMR